MCTKVDSTICFCALALYTEGVAEVEAMFTKENSLRFEYLSNHKWAVTRMIYSYDSEEELGYIHGFDAGMDLLCTKARLSKPEIAQSVKELACKIVEETAETLGSLTGKEKMISSKAAVHRN
jgi:hypothetical protein